MPLTRSQQAVIETWLQNNLRTGCPACSGRNFQVGDMILPQLFSSGGSTVGHGMPMVQLICGGCYYVMLVAAVPLGLAK